MTNTPTSHVDPSSAGSSPIVELRQYTLHPGQREVLIELFERALIEPQEEVGMRVLGQFIDRDDPDRFVWLRGFADMHSRRDGLSAFYGGPVWQAHRDAANATMIDSDNVLLLRAARSGAAFRPGDQRPTVGADGNRTGIVSAAILYLRTAGTERAAVDVFESMVAPAIAAAGGSLLGYFVSETSRNDFPRLPVRENEPVLAWFAGLADEPDSTIVARAASPFTKARLSRRIEHLRLAPTPRSLLTADTPSCAAAEALAERWQQRPARVERIGGMGP
jgi:NIPSNAP